MPRTRTNNTYDTLPTAAIQAQIKRLTKILDDSTTTPYQKRFARKLIERLTGDQR